MYLTPQKGLKVLTPAYKQAMHLLNISHYMMGLFIDLSLWPHYVL